MDNLQQLRTTGKIERRYIPAGEMRVKDNNGKSIVEGHAAVFNQWSENLGFFTERVLPGAFTKTIKDDDVRALFNHNPDYILGRNRAGTLKLSEDSVGLSYEIQMSGVTYARDLLESIERGDISQNSFGFETIEDRWFTEPDPSSPTDAGPFALQNRRELIAVRLFDVSPVTFPAYPQTDISARSLLNTVGINFDSLASAIFRAQRGLSLTTADRDLITASVQVLQSYLPPPDGSEGEGSGERSEAGRLKLLRKRLDLAEIAV